MIATADFMFFSPFRHKKPTKEGLSAKSCNIWFAIFNNNQYLCSRKQPSVGHCASGCSAVGSALRSGRRGRAFESPHPDQEESPSHRCVMGFFCACRRSLQHEQRKKSNSPHHTIYIYTAKYIVVLQVISSTISPFRLAPRGDGWCQRSFSRLQGSGFPCLCIGSISLLHCKYSKQSSMRIIFWIIWPIWYDIMLV